MTKFIILALLTGLIFAMASFIKPVGKAGEVPYPEGYRNWVHVKTTVVDSQGGPFDSHAGFHHIYANDKAMTGFKSGSFPSGSILVFDVIDAVRTNSGKTEGKRKMLDVMVKDPELYTGTGGWGFEEFKENSKTERVIKEAAVTKCFKCHSSREKNDFVFSSFRQ